jgi:hypothetical protein
VLKLMTASGSCESLVLSAFPFIIDCQLNIAWIRISSTLKRPRRLLMWRTQV